MKKTETKVLSLILSVSMLAVTWTLTQMHPHQTRRMSAPTAPKVLGVSAPSPTPKVCDGTAGDADCDGSITIADFEETRNQFRNHTSTLTADFNRDGSVNTIDVEIWRQHYFSSQGITTPVPKATATPIILMQKSSITTAPQTSSPQAATNTGVTATPTARPTAPPTTYTVRGNTIYDASGNRHIFRGVNRPSLEWSATGENLSLDDYKRIRDWNVNIVRLPLNQKYWREDTNGYRQRIAQNIQWIESLGMDTILDLHWSDKGSLSANAGQQRMADANSVTFWKEVAAAYAGDQRVLFELYNEPHDIPWDVWLNGGDTGDGFAAAGMQQLYNTVRATGAQNLVIVGGLNYAYDLSEVPGHRVQGSNIVYATHPYNFPGKSSVSEWDRGFGALSASDPVIMTEFGDTTATGAGGDCDASYIQRLLDYIKGKGISWTGWAWYPGSCGFPPIIKDWTGTPNQAGTLLKARITEF